MPGLAYYNGQISTYNDIRIPLSDRSIFFGDAVYDVMIGRSGRVYQKDEHIERLLHGARVLEINHGRTANAITSIISELTKDYRQEEFSVYVQISRKSEKREHIYAHNSGANLLVFTDTTSIRDSLVPISLISQNDLRYSYCNVKTVNLLPAVLASAKAHRMGADECVFLREGVVTECSRSNILIIKDGVLCAPRESEHILPGITMHNVFKICRENGIPVQRRDISYTELISADEILVTSTTKLARRVYKINGVPVGMKNASVAHIISDQLLSNFTNSDC